jgi:hypothetical protein
MRMGLSTVASSAPPYPSLSIREAMDMPRSLSAIVRAPLAPS